MDEGKEAAQLVRLIYTGRNDVFQWRVGGPIFHRGEPSEVPFSVANEILTSRWAKFFEVQEG